MFKFERRFIAPDDISSGPINAQYCTKIWLFVTLFFACSVLICETSTIQLCLYLTLAPILARLLALDLCHLVLPDLYTIPIIITGLSISLIPSLNIISFTESILGIFIGGGAILLMTILLEKVNHKSNMGGGDIKMIAAAGGFIGISLLPSYLWIACAVAFILYPLLKKNNFVISFGPALILSFWLLLLQPKIVEKSISYFM